MNDWKARDVLVRAERTEIIALASKWKLPLPWGPYRAAARSCFKCGERIVVYTWLGHGVRSDDRPPEPRPRTVVQRTTAQSRGMRYWLNSCPACKFTQGDNYLYDEGDDSVHLRLGACGRVTCPRCLVGPFLLARRTIRSAEAEAEVAVAP
jgi:hypothetical protein